MRHFVRDHEAAVGVCEEEIAKLRPRIRHHQRREAEESRKSLREIAWDGDDRQLVERIRTEELLVEQQRVAQLLADLVASLFRDSAGPEVDLLVAAAGIALQALRDLPAIFRFRIESEADVHVSGLNRL